MTGASTPSSLGDAPTVLDPSQPTVPDEQTSGLGLPASAKLGRYVLLDRLGAGGMGVVWTAFDPDLERKVAIKIVHPHSSSPAAKERLLREAKALAKLDHPNVVSVFDVGEHEANVFIAMEYVRGRTLTKWLKEETRSTRQILDTFIAAGRGLQAAHSRGLVHRDFKPDNVIVDTVGRVRVLDFGIAAHAGEDLAASGPTTAVSLEDSSPKLTRTGALVGTPAYMAPEQFEGREATAKTDQFAFCIALWEALYGERPFAGETLPELVRTVTQGELRRPQTRAGLPRKTRGALSRGLSLRPADRFDTLEDLLAQLEPRTGKRGLVVVGVLVAGLIVGLVAQSERGDACDAEGFIEQVWSDEAQAQVEAGIKNSGSPLADDVAARTLTGLNDWAQDWATVEGKACRKDPPLSGLEDERTLCLSAARRTFSATVDRFVDADADVIMRAHALVNELPAPKDCSRAEFLEAGPRYVPPELRETANAMEDQIAVARTLVLSAKYEAALEVVEAVLKTPRADELPAVLGSAFFERARAKAGRGRDADGAPDYRLALRYALRADDELLQARSLAALIWAAALDQDTEALLTQTALAWSLLREDIDGATLRLGRERTAELYNALGRALAALGEYNLAVGMFEASRGVGHGNPAIEVEALDQIAVTRRDQGEDAEAIEVGQRAAALQASITGKRHPAYAQSLYELGNTYSYAGKTGEALSAVHEAMTIQAATIGERHVGYANSLNLLGRLERKRENFSAARKALTEALDIYTEKDAPIEQAITLVALGEVERDANNDERSLEYVEKAFRILSETIESPTAYDLLVVTVNYAETLRRVGRTDEAKDHFHHVIEALRFTRPDDPLLEEARNGLADIQKAGPQDG